MYANHNTCGAPRVNRSVIARKLRVGLALTGARGRLSRVNGTADLTGDDLYSRRCGTFWRIRRIPWIPH